MDKPCSTCKHQWKEDFDELLCVYCGYRMYPNTDPIGPRWLRPISAENASGIADIDEKLLLRRTAQRKLPRR